MCWWLVQGLELMRRIRASLCSWCWVAFGHPLMGRMAVFRLHSEASLEWKAELKCLLVAFKQLCCSEQKAGKHLNLFSSFAWIEERCRSCYWTFTGTLARTFSYYRAAGPYLGQRRRSSYRKTVFTLVAWNRQVHFSSFWHYWRSFSLGFCGWILLWKPQSCQR